MNAPEAAKALDTPAFEQLAVSAIAPSTTSIQALRRARSSFGKESLQALADNIKGVGMIIEPIVVRPYPKDRPLRVNIGYEIIAGERRWLAGKLAGLERVPALVRTLDDDRVLKLQISENLQREDLHPLDEAEGYRELLRIDKIKPEQLAETLGKSRAWIFARLKLCELSPEVKKSFNEGRLELSVAQLLSRIPHHDTQRKALNDVLNDDDAWPRGQPMSYRRALDHIHENYMLELKGAPFKLEDAQLLPKAGACTTCPKRSGNQKDLFTDVKNPNVCTDPKCFQLKREATHVGVRQALEAKGETVVNGEPAKKIFPHWEEGNDHIANGYANADGTTYATGRSMKIRDLLGPDSKAVKKVQHPYTGKIYSLVHESMIASAARGGKEPKARKASNAKKTAGPKLPDLDQQVTDRLAELILEKAPKKFTKAMLLSLAKVLMGMASPRGEALEAAAKAWGWPAGALVGTSYGARMRLPPQADKLDERGIVVLLFHMAFADRAYYWQRKGVLNTFGINEEKVREEIKTQRARAITDARMKAKLQKGVKLEPTAKKKPAVKGKKK